MPRNNSRARQDQRQGVAEANTEARATRDWKGQLGVLDTRLGTGVGAVKERDRLLGQANGHPKPKDKGKPKVEATVTPKKARGNPKGKAAKKGGSK